MLVDILTVFSVSRINPVILTLNWNKKMNCGCSSNMDSWEVMTSGREWVWGTKQKVFPVSDYNQQHFLLLHLVGCNLELYYDAQTYEYQIYKCQTGKRSISVQKHQKQTVQSKCILLAVIWNYITMHRHMNIKFINAKQAKEAYQYRNIKSKLYKANASCWL